MSYRRQLFTSASVNNVVNAASASAVSAPSQSSSSSSSLQGPGKDLPEFNVAILGALGVGKSGRLLDDRMLYTLTRLINNYSRSDQRSQTHVDNSAAIGADFHRAMVASAPRRITPHRAPPYEELDLRHEL